MKLITAIVRPEKVNDVLAALFETDVRGLTVSPARGHGGETEEVETYRKAPAEPAGPALPSSRRGAPLGLTHRA